MQGRVGWLYDGFQFNYLKLLATKGAEGVAHIPQGTPTPVFPVDSGCAMDVVVTLLLSGTSYSRVLVSVSTMVVLKPRLSVSWPALSERSKLAPSRMLSCLWSEDPGSSHGPAALGSGKDETRTALSPHRCCCLPPGNASATVRWTGTAG